MVVLRGGPLDGQKAEGKSAFIRVPIVADEPRGAEIVFGVGRYSAPEWEWEVAHGDA